MSNVVIACNLQCAAPQGDGVLPILNLYPGGHHVRRNYEYRRYGQRHVSVWQPPKDVRHAPRDYNRDAYQWNISVPVSHRLSADLHQPYNWNKGSKKPKPAHRDIGIASREC